MSISYYDNIYNTPETFGYQIIATIGESGGYDWNLGVVWKDNRTGRLYGSCDSGCSCNSPFEGIKTHEGLTEISSEREARLIAEGVDKHYASISEAFDFVAKVTSEIKSEGRLSW